MTQNLRTIRDFTRYAMTRLSQTNASLGHGSEDLWQEATFLVLRSLALPFERLESFWDAALTQKEAARVLDLIDKRTEQKIPASYLLNEAWLTGHKFYVNENVLIPRSFIAELLEDALSPWVQDAESVTSVLDLCTGSGCLAILAQEAFPNTHVVGADISEAALTVAKKNVEDYGLTDSVELIRSDVFSNLKHRCFDVILCNPPYVTDQAMANLPAEYRKEPALALEAGPDGMDFMRRFMPDLRSHLTEDGMAFVEIGDGREAFETIWPNLVVTWLETSAGDDMVFCVRAADLKDAGL